jgi:hypothetical protein
MTLVMLMECAKPAEAQWLQTLSDCTRLLTFTSDAAQSDG